MDVAALAINDEQLDLIADRIAERIADRQFVSLVDAQTLAGRLSVSVDWVRRHQAELGAIRLGASVRFDADAVVERLRSTASVAALAPKPRTRRRRTPAVELLPIKGGA